jgi:hypothetical protein
VLELSDEHGRAIRRDELAHQPGPEEWRAWLAAHPLVMQRGRTAGRVEARVSGTVGDGARAAMPWQRGRFHFALPSGQPVRLALEIVVDGRVWRSLATGEGEDGFVGQAEPFWSPDGRRVAWWLEQSTEDDSAHGPTQYLVIAALGPRVELVVSPEAEALASNAIDQLEAAGVAPIFVSRAAARIERSVVRVAAGREDEARKLAARLPGTAEVEALSAPSLFDFSVVAGPELMQPVPSRPPRAKFRDLLGVRSPVARMHLLVGVLAAAGAVLAAWLWMRLESARLLRRTPRPRQ